MAISKEVKTGMLVASAIVIFFTGFYFLRGSDIFSNDKEYYCYYKSAGGLQGSSSVQIRGINVGHVVSMELAGEKGIKVTFAIKGKVAVPKGTIASLASADLLGTKVITLDLGSGPGEEPAGATLESAKSSDVVDQVSGSLTPRLEELKETIASFNVTLARVNSLLNEDNKNAITGTLQSLKTTSDNLAKLTNENGQLNSIIRNTNSITANLAKSNDTIRSILNNTNKLSAQLANAPIQKTIADLEKVAGELHTIMSKINDGKGTMGMLVNDKELYNNLNSSLKSINNLTDDLKARPGRYISFSVFGGKKKD